ncbi:phosphotransferase [Paenibacillus xanthanilyticus]|uniref:Phosphotransferase n=1 Tax=Paenibacillus xanthanilyticus TaxID=1783531 RepID=A0ABV8JW58_9BACL
METRLGRKIGEGACADVHEWEGLAKIIKLAKPHTNLHALNRELRNGRLAWEAGLPVPRPYGLAEADGRSGIVFERIDGESLMTRLLSQIIGASAAGKPDPRLDSLASDTILTAKLLHLVHSSPAPEMPSQLESLAWAIRRAEGLLPDEAERIIVYMEQLPRKRQLCHGNPNPGNIMLRGGHPVLLDWNDAACGNPEADLAEYIVMFRFADLPDHLPQEAAEGLDELREPIIRTFAQAYEQLSGIAYSAIEPWMLPVAARRLSISALGAREKARVLREVRDRLHRLAPASS